MITEETQSILSGFRLNPHFEILPSLLQREKIDADTFMQFVANTLSPLIEAHRNDNEVLRDEAYHYILPAIAVYETWRQYHADPLSIFREMWLHGAEKGAELLKNKAKDKRFLAEWIPNVTPKNCDTGAFLFDIRTVTETETEYHVLRCPYVNICRECGCPEIVTVFCDSDDISFGNIHPRLKWGRTKTIGRGDSICDFKYQLMENDEE